MNWHYHLYSGRKPPCRQQHRLGAGLPSPSLLTWAHLEQVGGVGPWSRVTRWPRSSATSVWTDAERTPVILRVNRLRILEKSSRWPHPISPTLQACLAEPSPMHHRDCCTDRGQPSGLIRWLGWKDVPVTKPYPKEFRDDVVRVARNREPGVELSQIAKDFGIHHAVLVDEEGRHRRR